MGRIKRKFKSLAHKIPLIRDILITRDKVENIESMIYRIRDIKTMLLKTNAFNVQGHPMFLDHRDSLDLARNGIFEPNETAYFKTVIKSGEVVLDIGANIGYYTLIFAKLVGDKGKVYAFEPDPENFLLLKKNTEMNGYKNVILVQKAVSDSNGKLRLYSSEKNKGDHRIYDSHDGRNSVEIESIFLDDYFREYDGEINLIKMDIQGAEGLAQRGMVNLLRTHKKIKIMTEFWPTGLKKCGFDPLKYLELYKEMNFKICQLVDQNIELCNIDKLLKDLAIENDHYANLLLFREENFQK